VNFSTVPPEPEVPRLIDNGSATFEAGRFSDALEIWNAALAKAKVANDVPGQVDASIDLGSAQIMLGRYPAAIQTLNAALQLDTKAVSPERLVVLKSTLGLAYGYSRQPDLADQSIGQALELAKLSSNPGLLAMVQYNHAILLAVESKSADAVAGAKESANTAGQAGDALTAQRATALEASIAAGTGDDKTAGPLLDSGIEHAKKLPDSHSKIFLLLNLGATAQTLALTAPATRAASLKQSLDARQAALAAAQARNDKRSQALALGALGGLYEVDGRHDDALALTRKSIFAAQGLDAPDLLYKLQWQSGRILAAKGDHNGAVDSYLHAVDTLQLVRNDVAGGNDNIGARQSFRKAVGSLYFEAADQLLQKADGESDPQAVNKDLLKARDTIELFKSAEIADFFENECVSLLKEKLTNIDKDLAPHTGVVYAIPLADRTEILVNTSAGMKRYKIKATADEVAALAHQFRLALETRGNNDYLDPSQKLYDLLIRPMESDLHEQQIDTLVFVPDGALRTIPMAALYDGNDFLIKNFAVAITPGIALMDPHPIDHSHMNVLSNGLSVSRQDFPALDSVPDEMSSIRKLFKGSDLLNEKFTQKNMQAALRNQSVNVVHIASHGNFGGDPQSTFILTYDDKMSLDGLEQLIRPVQYSGKPVELLTLSACQTASGDDRSALGLAGIALKAGARSALATLWYVSDEGSSILVTDFYAELAKDPTASKAQALQRAQLKLMEDRRFEHPCYWAPFMIIGNWM
jgi:CHAT domain-containing protein